MKAIVEGKQVELTDWFPPDVKPARPGWYHTGVDNGNPNNGKESLFCWFWDGKYWCYSDNVNGEITGFQNRWWRGLTKPWEGE